MTRRPSWSTDSIPALSIRIQARPLPASCPTGSWFGEKVLDICHYLGELEYLGFDIAITEEGFQVIRDQHPSGSAQGGHLQ